MPKLLQGSWVCIRLTARCSKAKFWLFPEVELAYNRGYDARTIKRLLEMLEQHRHEFEEFWNDFFA